MNLESGVSLGQLLLSFGTVLVVSGIAWGALLQRVKTLEKEVEAMGGFAADIAVIKVETKRTASQVDKLVDSWILKDPPPYSPSAPPRRRGA